MTNRQKGDPYYAVAEGLAQLCSTALCKIECVSNELG